MVTRVDENVSLNSLGKYWMTSARDSQILISFKIWYRQSICIEKNPRHCDWLTEKCWAKSSSGELSRCFIKVNRSSESGLSDMFLVCIWVDHDQQLNCPSKWKLHLPPDEEHHQESTDKSLYKRKLAETARSLATESLSLSTSAWDSDSRFSNPPIAFILDSTLKLFNLLTSCSFYVGINGVSQHGTIGNWWVFFDAQINS